MDELVTAIVQRLAEGDRTKASLLVAIDGAGGAGKSTFAAALTERLGQLEIAAEVVHMDDFYLPSSRRHTTCAAADAIGADFDWQRLRDQVLLPLSRQQSAVYQRYDWQMDALAEWRTLLGQPVVVVEGVYTLRRELLSFYDLTVWVDCPRAVRLARGIARDGESARQLWECEWMPQEDRYLEAHKPHRAASFCYSGVDTDDAAPKWRLVQPFPW